MKSLPKHVAIIMDGNGRWAKKRGLPRLAGHHAGAKSVRRIIKASDELGISALTLFAFGQENWSRPREEVDGLMRLFLQVLQKEVKKLHKKQVRVRIIGDHAQLTPRLQDAIHKAQQLTIANTGLQLTIAINYSGRWDIVNAMQKIAVKIAAGELTPEHINEKLLGSMLSLAELPEPDLFIRTSGEERISNFMLWQLAYTELYFTPVLWPDFDKKMFRQALDAYAQRDRRFGGVEA